MDPDPGTPPRTRPLPGVPEGLYRVAVSPRLVFPLYFTVAAVLLWRLAGSGAGWLLGSVLVALGVGTVTLLEYLIHRWLLHGRTRTLLVEVHRRHHAYPEDLTFAIIPLPASSVILGSCAALTYGLSRSVPVTTAVGVGLVLGYLFHETSHYRIHHSRPRTFLGRWLAANHNIHHHRHPHRNYGFATSFWDHVLRTYQQSQDSKKG
jgi:sterol desaturase/sphingolipid hydroxylase (fatty acid hydroxylase superfamily)